MSDDHLKESMLESCLVYRGKLLEVRADRVRLPDGSEAGREYVRHPGAVAVIAELESGRLIFERQYRYPVQRVMLELPAGKIDPGEDILDCARRELREETGYEAAFWRHLGTVHNCIGYSDERIEYFLARDLTHVGHERDHGEFLELLELTLEEALAAVRDGRITDGKTISGLFWAQEALHRG